MNTVALSRQLTPIEHFTVQVIGDEQHEATLWSALPAHIRPEHYKRGMMNLFLQKPEMLQYDPRLVFREVSKAASLGLALDPQLGEAYIVPAWNAKANRKEPELRCGYRGIMKLARQSAVIANIYPVEVCENDHFVHEQGINRRLEHRIDDRKPRGKPFCYYTVVIYKDGTNDFEVMNLEALYKIRDLSDSWKAFKAGKIKSSPWADHEGEMCKKTVIKRQLKRVPQSPELSDAMAMEDAADFAPNVTRLLPGSISRQLRVVETPAADEGEPTFDDAEEFEPAVPMMITAEQIAELRTMADEAGVDHANLCVFFSIADFAEIPAIAFDKVAKAIEFKRLKTARANSPTETSPPVVETPASPPAGKPPVSATPPADTGGDIENDPIAKATAAGRKACRAGVAFEAVPKEFARYINWAAAWQDGHDDEGRVMEAEARQ